MEKGWVKLYRRILENSFLMHDNNAFIVFSKLLMLVGQEKGQWSGGRMQLSEIVNINPNTVKDVLKRLEDNGMIHIESMKRYSVISITNWSIYQNKPNGGQKKSTPAKRPKGHQTTLEELTEVQQMRNRTPDLTPLAEQGSKRKVTPDLTPQRHHRDTNATPLYKEKEKNKNISTNVDTSAVATYGKPEINDMFDTWERIVGFPITSQVKQNRMACNNLLKKYKAEGLQKLIQGVNQAHGDRYGPSISDFIALQSDLNKLLVWGKKQGNRAEVII